MMGTGACMVKMKQEEERHRAAKAHLAKAYAATDARITTSITELSDVTDAVEECIAQLGACPRRLV